MKKQVLGIDGGGTGTDLALADLEGNIKKNKKAGPANPRNFGIEEVCENIKKGVSKLSFKKEEVVSTFVGLPAIREEYESEKDRIKEILGEFIPGKIEVGSDQEVAFFSGTDKDYGVVAISGTGGVVTGFKDGKVEKAAGWGYFGDEGSGFWVGIEVYRKIAKHLDKRGKETIMTDMAFEKWNLKDKNDFNRKIYQNPMKSIPQLSVFADYAERKGDKVAKDILSEAVSELLISIKTVSEKLQLKKFPLVLVGGMFKSDFFRSKLSTGVENMNQGVEIIKPENKPVYGAVKLALKNINE